MYIYCAPVVVVKLFRCKNGSILSIPSTPTETKMAAVRLAVAEW